MLMFHILFFIMVILLQANHKNPTLISTNFHEQTQCHLPHTVCRSTYHKDVKNSLNPAGLTLPVSLMVCHMYNAWVQYENYQFRNVNPSVLPNREGSSKECLACISISKHLQWHLIVCQMPAHLSESTTSVPRENLGVPLHHFIPGANLMWTCTICPMLITHVLLYRPHCVALCIWFDLLFVLR